MTLREDDLHAAEGARRRYLPGLSRSAFYRLLPSVEWALHVAVPGCRRGTWLVSLEGLAAWVEEQRGKGVRPAEVPGPKFGAEDVLDADEVAARPLRRIG